MKAAVISVFSGVFLAGCGLAPADVEPVGEARTGGISSDVIVRPKARPSGLAAAVAQQAPVPASGASTAEAFDTTTSAQREAAATVDNATGERALGTTIASLGSPSEPGFWIKTPLVSTETEGRVVFPATGKSVQVTLVPIEGPPTAGSRMSLPALRLLEAPLAGLSEVEVFAQI